MTAKNIFGNLVFIAVIFIFSSVKGYRQDSFENNSVSLVNYNLSLGLRFKESGKYDSSIHFLKKVNKLNLSGKSDYHATVQALYAIGCIEDQKNQNKKALLHFKEANNLLIKNKEAGPFGTDILYRIGKQYFTLNNFDQATHFLNQCILQSVKDRAADTTMARTFRLQGLIEYYKGDYSNAIENLQKSVILGEKSFGKFSLFVSDQVNNLGVMSFMIGNYDEAMAYYKKSASILNLGKISSSEGLAGTYVNIGLIFKLSHDYVSALQFFEKGLELLLSSPHNSRAIITTTYLNIGTTYRMIENPKKEFEAINKSLIFSKMYNPVMLPKVYEALAIYCTDNNDYNKAEFYYRCSLQSAQKLFEESPDIAYYYNNYGEFQAKRNHFSKSLEAFQKALKLYLKLFGERNPSTSGGYLNLSNHYVSVKKPDQALFYIQKAIIANSRDFNDPDEFSNPQSNQAISIQLMVELLEQKSSIIQILVGESTKSNEIYNYQHIEWKTYQLTLALIENIRNSFINEESRLFLYQNEQKTYKNALECALKLFQTTRQPYYLEQAFNIADKTHASSLQSTIREKGISKKFRPSDTLLIRENTLKKDLSLYQELILKEQSIRNPDVAKIKLWTSKTTDNAFQLKQLMNQLKIYKPAWYGYEYQNSNQQLLQLVRSNLKADEILIEYFYTDSILYSFCVSLENIVYRSDPLPTTIENSLTNVLSFVKQPKVYITDSLEYINYRRAATSLYNLLIKPYESKIKGKNLIIIPFDKLTYLPFETLLTHETFSKAYNFKELPYLIKQNSIRYLYAARLCNIRGSTKYNPGMAAFAATYGTSEKLRQSGKEDSQVMLSRLQETSNEVKEISNYFPGKTFTANEASEENFKKYAASYDILHLAMHSIIDDEAPLYSRLVFTPGSSKTEDDLLHTYEIQNLNLNADLVVLSACNTGIGKLQKGEGMMSLTRGFAFAGIPSIVMTLWQVNDKSGSILMKNFYSNLSQGSNKANALQKAKSVYLETTDIIHAHPYYWASYILIGDNSSLKKPVHSIMIGSIISVIIIFFIILYLFRKK